MSSHDDSYPLSRDSSQQHARLNLITNLYKYSHRLDEFYSKLQNKMKTNTNRVHGFPMHDEMIYTFSPDTSVHSICTRNNNTNVNDPTDVQISYNLNLILITDYLGSKIELFDLETKKHKNSVFPLPQQQPFRLCIEENYDGQNNEAIILCCKYDIFKYDLKQFLTIGNENQEHPVQYIWKIPDCACVLGLTISYSTRQLYVCDQGYGGILIFNLQSGEFVYKFPVNDPFDLAFVDHDQYLVVTQVSSYNALQIFKKEAFNATTGESEWKSIKTIGCSGHELGEFHNPCSVIFDRFSRNLLVCDNGNHRIKVFSCNNFELICTLGSKEKCFHHLPFSCCLNEFTGELLVCQSEEWGWDILGL